MNDVIVAHFSEQASARAREIAMQMVVYWETIRDTDMPESVVACLLSDYQSRALDAVMGIDPTVQALIDAGGEMDIEA